MHSVTKRAAVLNEDLSFKNAQKNALVPVFISQSNAKSRYLTTFLWTFSIYLDGANSEIIKPTLNLFYDEVGAIITPDTSRYTRFIHNFT